MRKKTFAVILLAVGFASSTPAQMTGKQEMGDGMHGGQGMSMGMGMCPLCKMGDQLGAACHIELGALGLPAGTVKELEDGKFELRKTVIRKKADLQILQLDLQRMVEDKAFDLSAAQKKVQAMAEIGAEIQGAHLGFLHAMAAKLTDEQWQNLQQEKNEMMMPMMGRGGMMQGRMQESQQGGMMKGGGMMQSGEQGGGAGHHPGAATEAEQFFKKE
ncbi:MAG: hypothetical protein P1P84_00980 [Deferrisomatales bacterium]|nr:hypothetical protein [Deferrisomatales bacterium]